MIKLDVIINNTKIALKCKENNCSLTTKFNKYWQQIYINKKPFKP